MPRKIGEPGDPRELGENEDSVVGLTEDEKSAFTERIKDLSDSELLNEQNGFQTAINNAKHNEMLAQGLAALEDSRRILQEEREKRKASKKEKE